MIKTILFDFNGVIIDDEPLQLKAAQAALQTEGISLTEQDYYDALGMDDVTFMRSVFTRAGREQTDEVINRVLAEMKRLHREMISDELPLFPGVVTFIKALARHYPLAVVSMARRTEIEYVLERAGLAKSFTIIVSAEDVSACKPDPACVNRALEKLNEARRADGPAAPLASSECLVIEDAPPGIQAARTAGMRTLGVTNTVSEAALRAAGADVVTHSLADWTDDAVRHVFN